MKTVSQSLIAALAMVSATLAVPMDGAAQLLSRDTLCTLSGGQSGTCITTSACAAQGGTSEAGHCPGAANIQCCTLQPTCAPPEVNDATISMLKGLESFSPNPYPDAGKWSIGYGHQCSQTKCTEMSVPIDEPTAVTLMTSDLLRFRKCLTAKVGSVTLNENQYGALISWTYNVGCANMASSTLATRLLAGEDPNTVAAEELPKWRLSQGQINPVLVSRRQTEIALFQTWSDIAALPVSC